MFHISPSKIERRAAIKGLSGVGLAGVTAVALPSALASASGAGAGGGGGGEVNTRGWSLENFFIDAYGGASTSYQLTVRWLFQDMTGSDDTWFVRFYRVMGSTYTRVENITTAQELSGTWNSPNNSATYAIENALFEGGTFAARLFVDLGTDPFDSAVSDSAHLLEVTEFVLAPPPPG